MDTRARVVIYSRPEDIENLMEYSKSKGFKVIETFEKLDTDNRMDLYDLIDYLSFNGIDKVLIPTCSTVSRKPAVFTDFVNGLNDTGVSLIVLRNNMESLMPDGSFNLSFQMLVEVISEFDEVQKRRTRERLERSYNLFRDNGGRVGRKTGYRKKEFEYRKEYGEEIRLLGDGISLKKCKERTGTSVNTLRKLKTMFV